MSDAQFLKPFKEVVSLNKRFRFINILEDVEGRKQTIDYLVDEAEWEIEQIKYEDEIVRALEKEGKSDKQIENMKNRAIAALQVFIVEYEKED